MAKKKNSPKKHKFKYAAGSADFAPNDSTEARREPTIMSGSARAVQPAVSNQRDFSYVAKDVRRIGIMVGLLVAVELALYAFHV